MDDGRGQTAKETDVLVRRLLAVVERTHERQAQLQHALDSRVAIEQAKGVLAERLGVAPDAAFTILRQAARSNRMRVHDLARAVVAGEDVL